MDVDPGRSSFSRSTGWSSSSMTLITGCRIGDLDLISRMAIGLGVDGAAGSGVCGAPEWTGVLSPSGGPRGVGGILR